MTFDLPKHNTVLLLTIMHPHADYEVFSFFDFWWPFTSTETIGFFLSIWCILIWRMNSIHGSYLEISCLQLGITHTPSPLVTIFIETKNELLSECYGVLARTSTPCDSSSHYLPNDWYCTSTDAINTNPIILYVKFHNVALGSRWSSFHTGCRISYICPNSQHCWKISHTV